LLFGQKPPKPKLISAQLPRYPVLARRIQTQGEVQVEFVLKASGETSSVIAVSGSPLLKAAAEDHVRSIIFDWRIAARAQLSNGAISILTGSATKSIKMTFNRSRAF